MKKYFLVLYLIILAACDSNDDYNDDLNKCQISLNTKDDCSKTNLKIPENYCCLTHEEPETDEPQCEYITEEQYFIYSDSKSYALGKEILGFNCYDTMNGEYYPDYCQERADKAYKKIYECKNGNATETNQLYTFSDSEKKILSDENHCLAHIFQYVEEKITKKNCSDALLTDQAKKEGITCALYEFAYTLKNKDNKMTRNSCYLFNPDSINNEAKAKREIKKFAMSLLFDDEEPNFENFQVTISDNADHSFSYDSATDTLKNSDSNSNSKDNAANTSSSNNSRLISFSKCLFLLLLISF